MCGPARVPGALQDILGRGGTQGGGGAHRQGAHVEPLDLAVVVLGPQLLQLADHAQVSLQQRVLLFHFQLGLNTQFYNLQPRTVGYLNTPNIEECTPHAPFQVSPGYS